MARKKSNRSRGSRNVTPATIVYNGVVRGNGLAVPDDTITARLSFTGAVTGGSTGALYAFSTLTLPASTDWPSYANTYSEYRILGFELDYLPHYPGGNSAVIQGAGMGITIHSSEVIAPGATLDQFCQHADWKSFYTSTEFNMQWKMSSVEEAVFESTASPPSVSKGSIGILAPSATTGGAYGYYVVTYLVQFRDRK